VPIVDFDLHIIVAMLDDFKKFFDSHISHLGANRSRSYIYFLGSRYCLCITGSYAAGATVNAQTPFIQT
jgi:hypothetical protein